MPEFVNDRGQTIFTGQEALSSFSRGLAVTALLREARKLHYKTSFQDIPISVENRKGSVRRGTDPDGDEWKTKMKRPYGYIPGTKGADGDALDVFVGPDEDAGFAYIVHSNCPDTGEFDEDKIMLGFSSSQSAKRCFLQHYDDPKFFGGIDKIPMWKFNKKLWTKKETSRKLVASRRAVESQAHAASSLRRYDRGMTPILFSPVALVHRDYSDTFGSLDTHENIEKNLDLYTPDTMPSKLKKKGKFTGVKEVKKKAKENGGDGSLNAILGGTGTDQNKKMAILGHHQDIMKNPAVRESRPPFTGRKKEHGTAGMHWGQRDRDHAQSSKAAALKHGFKADPHMPGFFNKGLSQVVVHKDGRWSHTSLKDGTKKGMGGSNLHFHLQDHAATEAREHGRKGMKWGDRTPKEIIEHVGKQNGIQYRGIMKNEKTGEHIHLFQDPQSGTSMAMKTHEIKDPKSVRDKVDATRAQFKKQSESREHGIQGQKWGSHKPRTEGNKGRQKSAAPPQKQGKQKPKATKPADLLHDPKTASMMQVVKRSQSQLNAIAHRGQQVDQQRVKNGKPPLTTEQKHGEAVNALKELGWKILEAGARMTGTEGVLGAVKSIVQSPAGQKMTLQSDRAGHTLHSAAPTGEEKRRQANQGSAKSTAQQAGGKLSVRKRESRRTREGKVWFARSMRDYGSAAEAKDLATLRDEFDGDDVVAVKCSRQKTVGGMKPYHKQVEEADSVVIRPFRGKRISAGVWSEARHAMKKGIPVRMLRHGKLHEVKRLKIRKNPRARGSWADVILKK